MGKNRVTAYPELPQVDPKQLTEVSIEKSVHILLDIVDECLAKAVFAIMIAESKKTDDKKSFKSAGHYNYSGIQTDGDRWGYSKPITGRFWKVDSGNNNREFAAFSNNEGFFDFMANRIKSKGFDGCNGDQWTTTYIQSWWSPGEKASYTKGTQKFNDKLAIYNTAIRTFNDAKKTYKKGTYSLSNSNTPLEPGQPTATEPKAPPPPPLTYEEKQELIRKQRESFIKKETKVVNGKSYIFNVAGQFSITQNTYLTPPGTQMTNPELGTFSILELNLQENPYDYSDIEQEDFNIVDYEYQEELANLAEEYGISIEELVYQEQASNQQDSSTVSPQQAGTGAGTPANIKPVKGYDALMDLAGQCARELGKNGRVNASNLKKGYIKGVHGLCPQGTQAVAYALTGVKAVGMMGNADWFSFKNPTIPAGGENKGDFSKTGIYNQKVKPGGGGKAGFDSFRNNPSQWQVGDIIAMGYTGKSYGHIQIYTGYCWQSDFKQGGLQVSNVDFDSVALWRLNAKGLEAVKKQTS